MATLLAYPPKIQPKPTSPFRGTAWLIWFAEVIAQLANGPASLNDWWLCGVSIFEHHTVGKSAEADNRLEIWPC